MKKDPIPGIDKILPSEIKKLGLHPSVSIHEALPKSVRWYTTICKDQSGKKFLFKGVLFAPFTPRLQHEIRINRHFKKIHIYGKLRTQRLIASKISQKSTWLLLEFIDGIPTGWYFDLRKRVQGLENPMKFSDNILALQRIQIQSAADVSEGFLQKTSRFYIKDLEKFRKNILSVIQEKAYRAGIRRIQNNSDLLRKKMVLAHGDTAFANHIYGKDSNIYLLDWEQCHFNNPAFDIGFLWIQSWKYPAWRKKLLKTFLASVDHEQLVKKIFPIMATYFSLREIGLWYSTHNYKGYWHVALGNKMIRISPKSIQSKEALKSHLSTLKKATNIKNFL